jgi:hypothetical protein
MRNSSTKIPDKKEPQLLVGTAALGREEKSAAD